MGFKFGIADGFKYGWRTVMTMNAWKAGPSSWKSSWKMGFRI